MQGTREHNGGPTRTRIFGNGDLADWRGKLARASRTCPLTELVSRRGKKKQITFPPVDERVI